MPRALAASGRGWLAGVGAMWFWHAPALCNAAVASRRFMRCKPSRCSLLGASSGGRSLRRAKRSAFAARRDHLPVHRLRRLQRARDHHHILAGHGLLDLHDAADRPARMLQTIRTDWGFTPERDQQIGGLLMWVPMCLIYLGAIFAQLARWFAQPASPATDNVL